MRRLPALLLFLASAGCSLDERLVLSVTAVPTGAASVELLITRGDGADSQEPLRFTPTRSETRQGDSFTVGLYLPRDASYRLGAAARDAAGCVLAAQTLPFQGSAGQSSLALQPFSPDADSLSASLPRVCTPFGPAVRDLLSSPSTLDEYTLSGWAFGAATQVRLAALPDSSTRDGYAGCAPTAAGACALEDAPNVALSGVAPDFVARVDPATLTLRGTHISSGSGAIGLCALLYEGTALRTCAPVATNLLQFEQQTVDLGVDFHPGWLAVGDLDNDRSPDLALAGSLGSGGDQGGAALVLLNQKAGARYRAEPLAAPADTSRPYPRLSGMFALASAAGVAVADIDGDQKPDLLVADSAGDRVALWLGGSAGPKEGSAPLYLPAGLHPEVSLAADVNGDGRADVLVVNDVLSANIGQVSALLNQSPGPGQPQLLLRSMEVGRSLGFAAVLPRPGALAPDVLVSGVKVQNGAAAGVVFLLRSAVTQAGQQDGLYLIHPDLAQREAYVTNSFLGGLVTGDVDGDGVADAVVAGVGQIGSQALATQLNILRGDAQAAPLAFAPTRRTLAGAAPFSVALGDINGDRLPDLVVANAQDGRRGAMTVLLNQEGGQFPAGGLPRFPVGDDSSVVALADVDQDGAQDIIVVSQGHKDQNPRKASAGRVTLFLNRTPRRVPLP